MSNPDKKHNPYAYDPSEDEDLFQNDSGHVSTNHKHSVDGSVCGTCGIVHIPDDELNSLPPEAREQLLRLLDSMPDSIARQLLATTGVSREAQLVRSFFNFFGDMEGANYHGPTLRSIIEFLDEQSGGRLIASSKAYEFERQLIIAHSILKMVVNALSASEAAGTSHSILKLVNFLKDYMLEHIESLTADYVRECEKAKYSPIRSIIESGVYPREFNEDLKKLMLGEEIEDLIRRTDES